MELKTNLESWAGPDSHIPFRIMNTFAYGYFFHGHLCIRKGGRLGPLEVCMKKTRVICLEPWATPSSQQLKSHGHCPKSWTPPVLGEGGYVFLRVL